MKKDIHPQVNTDVTVTCVCGNSFVTNSTLDKITVEICSNCHPFYTGTQKFVDTEGRIDKFEKKRKLAEEKKKERLLQMPNLNAAFGILRRVSPKTAAPRRNPLWRKWTASGTKRAEATRKRFRAAHSALRAVRDV